MSNLKFRKLEETDLETMRRWRMLPEVTKYLFTDPVLTVEDQKQWYEEMKEKGDSIYWIVNFENIDIGYATLFNINKRMGESGVYIGEIDYRRKGLSKIILRKIVEYAFETLNLHKLYGCVLSENYPALISYLKNGWKVEGVLRDHIFKHDRFYDVYMVTLFRAEWMKK